MNIIQQDKNDSLEGELTAICYSGFRSGQYPDRGWGAVNPSDEEILEDLKMLKDLGFNLIRMYDSGQNTQDVIRIIEEHGLEMKMLLGIWLNAEISAHESCPWMNEPIPQDVLEDNKFRNLEEIQQGILLATNYPEVVVAVNVGNEALVDWNDHKVDVNTVISYVKHVKGAIEQPVTVAENYIWWASSGKELAEAVDFVSIHTYPVWEGKDIDEAISYTIENVQQVRNALPDAKIVITEAGWASVATEFGERASEEKQLRYYNELKTWTEQMNITTFFFEAFDEDWKGDPNNMQGAEKHWGLFTVDRKPKQVIMELMVASTA